MEIDKIWKMLGMWKFFNKNKAKILNILNP